MKIGILGGTFDPVHDGHIEIANAAADACFLDKVFFIPTGHPPHKLSPLASGTQRMEMTRLAAASDSRFEVSDIEVGREGTTYTVDTLKTLREHFAEETRFFYIIGSDTLAAVDKWKNFEEICGLCAFIAVMRPGSGGEAAAREIERLSAFGAEVIPINHIAKDVSSSEIRLLSAEGKPLSGLVPESVEGYIHESGVYAMAKIRGEIDIWLKENLSAKRYAHTLGVEHTAVSLAAKYSADMAKASLAALLHDCAKEFPESEQISLVKRAGAEPDPVMLKTPQVMHGIAGAQAARELFGVSDGEILTAVASHTMGRPAMSLLEKIIFIADYIEPGRKYHWAENLRKLAAEDLDKACAEALAITISHIINERQPIHGQTIDSYNYFKIF